MIEDTRLIVNMGEVKIGSGGDILKATLGSCIGIAFLWKHRGRCGLAHCLLPEAPKPTVLIGARYVSQAVPSLLALMGIKKQHYSEIEIVIAGGARMFGDRKSTRHVGRSNAEAAQKCLLHYGLTVMRSDIGGRRGRQMIVDCSGPSVTITDIVQIEEHRHDCSSKN